MLQKICKPAVISIVVIGIIVVLLNMGCGGGEDVLAIDPNTYDTPVCFRVNSDGTGFRNIGTGGAEFKAEAKSAEDRPGGAFEMVDGRRVFNTMGQREGTWLIPWFAPNTWDRYVDIGWVEFCQNTADLIATSDEWTVEIIFALEVSHQADMIDQYVWSFIDKKFPDRMIGLCWRYLYIRAIDLPGLTGGESGLINLPNAWTAASEFRGGALGRFAHVVTTKNIDGILSTYFNGTLVSSQPTQFRPSDTAPWVTIPYPDFQEGAFRAGYFGRTPYNGWEENGDNAPNALGNDLPNAALYHFALDGKLWDAGEVEARFMNSVVGRDQLVFW
jgi:hypothetical protein